MLVPVEIPPGVVETPTKTSKSSNWAEANLVRWTSGKLGPVGGWERLNYAAPASPYKAVHTWVTNAGDRLTAYVCMGHVYVDRGDGAMENISPAVSMAMPSVVIAGGYGDSAYSFDKYGTPRPNRADIEPITPGYYVDNWGQNLCVMTSTDGRLLMWDPTVPGAKLTAVAGAPIANRAFVITPQRHVVLFGAGGIFNRFSWCSQEDINNWNYSDITKSAGFFEIQPASIIITASKAGDEVVFWTSSGDTYVINYIGVPYVFGYELIGEGSVPVSPMSVAETPGGTVWVASNGFWRYESRSIVPIPCPVWNWFLKKVNAPYARYNSAMVPFDNNSEIWWFFPELGSMSNTHYLQWNFKDGWWSQGKLARSAGASSTYTDYPILASDSKVFRHETGNYFADQLDVDLPWAKTFNINAAGGSLLSTFMRILPDIEGDIASIAFELEYNIPRSGNGANTKFNSGMRMMGSDGFVPFRNTGRDFRVKMMQYKQGIGPWTIGENQFDIVPRGGQ